jgi:cation diffusion facilitator CzcD-associated flavoprotein CzcO
MNTKTDLHVVIIGAGITGLVLAQALKKVRISKSLMVWA